MRTLKFDKGIAEIDLKTLSETANYELARGGLPKARPTEHHELIGKVYDMITDMTNKNINPEPIIISEKQTARVGYKGEPDKCPVKNFLVQRLVTKINIANGKDFNSAVALSFNESGIMIGYGMNVSVCMNMNIFGDNIRKTYSTGKIAYDDMMEYLEQWLSNHTQKHEQYVQVINKMKEVSLNKNQIDELFGKLTRLATLSIKNTTYDSPLNVTQIIRMINESRESKINPAKDTNSIWDINQWGTSILKFVDNDIMTILETTNRFNNFLLQEYCMS